MLVDIHFSYFQLITRKRQEKRTQYTQPISKSIEVRALQSPVCSLHLVVVVLIVNARLLSINPDKVQDLFRIASAHQPFLKKNIHTIK